MIPATSATIVSIRCASEQQDPDEKPDNSYGGEPP